MNKRVDLSAIIPTVNENENIIHLIPEIRKVLSGLTNYYEIIVVDGGSKDNTVDTARSLGAKTIIQKREGYGGALKDGFECAKGTYILTMDADLSHEPKFIKNMWESRQDAKIIIGSRYIPGGAAKMPFVRKLLSIILNLCFSRILSLPIKDLSSGFRLYHRHIISEIVLDGRNFEILEEILIKCIAQGYKIIEIPLIYVPRKSGRSKAKLFKFGVDLLKTLTKMWCLRNSISSADYDERAYNSIIPFQRYWQRKRHNIITKIAVDNKSILDIGCGSSQIIKTLNNVTGIDININRLHYMRQYKIPLANASAFALPFKNNVFDCVICSQVIEHIPFDMILFQEMRRVLKAGGCLIIGTPDYSKITWRIIEFLYGIIIPGGYKDEHITHYNRKELNKYLCENGFNFISKYYICNSELIMRFERAE